MANAKTKLARLNREIAAERDRLRESGHADSYHLAELQAAQEALRHQDRRSKVRVGG